MSLISVVWFMSFVRKARVFQSSLLYNHSFKKKLRQRSYRVFLQLNTGYLPRIRTLEAWRKRLLYASFISLSPACLMTIIDPFWPSTDLLPVSYVILGLFSPVILSGSLFLILLSFSLMFDHVICKRTGLKKGFY